LETQLITSQLKKKLTANDFNNLLLYLKKKLDPKIIEQIVKNQFLKNFPPDELQELYGIYNQDLMKKISTLEGMTESEDLLEKAEKYGFPYFDSRKDLLARLIEIQGAQSQAIFLTFESIKALHHGLKKILPPEKMPTNVKMENGLGAIKTMASKSYRQMILLRYNYTYRDLSENELKKFIELSDNRLLRKARETTLAGFKTAFASI
jgi:hypothetical protein